MISKSKLMKDLIEIFGYNTHEADYLTSKLDSTFILAKRYPSDILILLPRDSVIPAGHEYTIRKVSAFNFEGSIGVLGSSYAFSLSNLRLIPINDLV